ncbi:MAG: host attachment protein [Deltaproteobacteria bacterium]|nr:host attachment protein [Deltaproteobacteria bacterium]
MDLEKLNLHVRNLVTLSETDSPLISCYANLETGRTSYRDALDARTKEIRRALPSDQRRDFEQALGRIETFLASEINPEANGVALFSRGGGPPFFLALQFRLALPNLMLVDSVPHIYELVVLKDTYHRYIVLISTDTHARIVEVSVGNVTKELWTKRPELRKRVGRELTSEHYQNHRRDRTEKFIKEKIEILDRLVAKEGHTHLILAGNPRTVARVRARLPKRLEDKLIDVVPVSGDALTADVVTATLSAFAEHEQMESTETAGLLLDELRTAGLAVSGTDATLEALVRRQVDVLVLSESYAAPAGWKCYSCETVGVDAAPIGCPQCGEQTVEEIDLMEEMVGMAERFGCTVEIVRNSDVLFDIGGVGCLLRHLLPGQRMVRLQEKPV